MASTLVATTCLACAVVSGCAGVGRGARSAPAPSVAPVGPASRRATDAEVVAAAADAPLSDAPERTDPPDVADVRPPAVGCESGIEWDVGAAVGASFPGHQDLKFKRTDATGRLVDYLFSQDVDASTEAFEEAYLGLWFTQGRSEGFGFRLAVTHWTTTAQADEFVDRVPGGSTVAAPPFDRVAEDRLGVFASLERRFPLFARGRTWDECVYAYAGLGGGFVRSEVQHADTLWKPAVDVNAGLSVPLGHRVRAFLQGEFIVAHDNDSWGRAPRWRVDTSGTGVTFLKPHLDTRFLVAVLGLEVEL